MTIKPIDAQHFYIDDQLIDLNWIRHQIKQQTTAANYHAMQRGIRWLTAFANRLMEHELQPNDEAQVRQKLIDLGFGWYFERKSDRP